jgi:hypothetical protein
MISALIILGDWRRHPDLNRRKATQPTEFIDIKTQPQLRRNPYIDPAHELCGLECPFILHSDWYKVLFHGRSLPVKIFHFN